MLLPDGAFREIITFTPEETDPFGRVDGRAILRRFQKIAGDHFDSLGFGRDIAVEHGCFWAAARTAVQIRTLPETGAALTLDTWPGRQAHGLYRRHYQLTDGDGGTLLRGMSVWVLMDLETRTLSAHREWMTHPGGISRPGELPGNIKCSVPAQLPLEARRTVTGAEADENGHLNNTEYLRWGTDLLSPSFAAAHRLSGLCIEYKKELLLGQSAVLRYMTDETSLYVRAEAEEKESFILRCDYDPV